MKSGEPTYYNIQTLANKTGLTRRTVRYYVQRGLLPKPEGGGRGHYYTDEHLKRIEIIKHWQAQGVPLEKMRQLLTEGKLHTIKEKSDFALTVREPSVEYFKYEPGPSHWTRITIGPDVELNFKTGTLSAEDQKAIKEFILTRLKHK